VSPWARQTARHVTREGSLRRGFSRCRGFLVRCPIVLPDALQVRGFLRVHGTNVAGQPHPFVEHLWGEVRSGHFHAGDFPLGEYGPFRADFLFDEKSVEASRLRFSGLVFVRRAIIDWCLTKVAVAEPSGE